MKFRIARSSEGGRITTYDVFDIDVKPGWTVLDALFKIQDDVDPSLSFRYSCRGAVCGSCAMLIDKVPRLACRTQVRFVKDEDSKLKPFAAIVNLPKEWEKDSEILIEPLPNMPILKDLVVDMTRFFDVMEEMQLWAEPVDDEHRRTQSPEERGRIKRYVNCILCALCYGSCPVNAEKPEYVGPAALAKAWRFIVDSRIENTEQYLEAVEGPNASELCDLIMNCVRVCPKDVAPGGAIRKVKNLDKE